MWTEGGVKEKSNGFILRCSKQNQAKFSGSMNRFYDMFIPSGVGWDGPARDYRMGLGHPEHVDHPPLII